MKNILVILIVIMPLFCSAQWYIGQGIFPIDTIFTFDILDTSVIKIPANSIWQISQIGKTGLENSDSSKVIITDTSKINVALGDYYFELSLPNYLITGDTTHNVYSTGYEFWNYDIIITHKHNITDSSSGRILFRNVKENNFDTLKFDWGDFCYFPFFTNSNNYTGFFYPYNSDFDYSGGIIKGIRDSLWVYSDISSYMIPSKKSLNCVYSNDYNYDTTTIRLLYSSRDSLSGGPGWMIKSIKMVTYNCTSDCPSQIDKNKNDENRIFLYPNPSSKYVYIEFDEYNKNQVEFSLYDCIGKQYKLDYRKDGNNYILNIENLLRGIYSLIVYESNLIVCKRFIKVD